MNSAMSLSIASDIIALAPSSLFDRRWYEACYPESAWEGGDPLVYFCDRGWRRGHAPNPYFDVAFYLARNPDVREMGLNPLVHYLHYGEAEWRWPSLHFDPEWYRAQHGLAAGIHCLSHLMSRLGEDEAAPNAGFDPQWYRAAYGPLMPPGLSAFADFRLRGVAEARHPSLAHREVAGSPLFNATFYREINPAVVESGLDPAYHFCAIGWREKLRPSPDFDPAWYEANYIDVRTAGINPLLHYLRFGAAEGRLPLPPEDPAGRPADAEQGGIVRSGLFDADFYLAHSPDVRATGLAAIDHFCRFGWREGRRPNPYFDPLWYDRSYLGGRHKRNPLLHYIDSGEQAGCRPIVYFEPDWYRETYHLDDLTSPLRHFLEHRRSQLFSPTRHFDLSFYMAAHGEAVGRNRDPFMHFLRTAITRDVDPSAAFDLASYRASHMGSAPPPGPAVPGAEVHRRTARERLNPLVHFLLQAAGDPDGPGSVIGSQPCT